MIFELIDIVSTEKLTGLAAALSSQTTSLEPSIDHQLGLSFVSK
jgi:hypothetical protein